MRVIKGPLGAETVTLSTVVDENKDNSSGEWFQTLFVQGMMRTSITMMNNVKIYVDLKEKLYRDGGRWSTLVTTQNTRAAHLENYAFKFTVLPSSRISHHQDAFLYVDGRSLQIIQRFSVESVSTGEMVGYWHRYRA
jgi:hypothetical protein